MNDATKKDLEGIVIKVVEELSEVINSLAQNMHSEIMRIDQKLDQKSSQNSIDRLTNTIDGFIKRLDENETEMTARDAQFDKLLAWAKKVSKETGIPLEGF